MEGPVTLHAHVTSSSNVLTITAAVLQVIEVRTEIISQLIIIIMLSQQPPNEHCWIGSHEIRYFGLLKCWSDKTRQAFSTVF